MNIENRPGQLAIHDSPMHGAGGCVLPYSTGTGPWAIVATRVVLGVVPLARSVRRPGPGGAAAGRA